MGPEKAKKKWSRNAGQKHAVPPTGKRVVKDGDSFILHIANNSVKLPDSILEKSNKGELMCNFSGVFTDKHCFVAVHENVGYPHDVACIDRQSGKLVWVKEACGCWLGGASGIHESWVSVTIQNDQVVIFRSRGPAFICMRSMSAMEKTISNSLPHSAHGSFRRAGSRLPVF